jgi:riboflavin synthase alpha subunit
MQKIFFSQAILDALISEGKITLDGNILTLITADKPSFELEPGYRITRTADNSPDPHGLVGAIKYEKDLRAMNAELYLDSVLYRETAYVADAGFIGEKKELLDRLSDTELLARFLLDSLL